MLPSWLSPRSGAESAAPATHAVLETQLNAPLMADQEEAIFACGCFWGAEKGFWRLPGVVSTAVGYAGGQTEQPTYNQVCSGRTGHTEVVRVVWSRPAVDFSDLLKLFWECHDPTQGDRQGNDCGSQYRSTIYANDSALIELASASAKAYQELLNAAGFAAITTEIRQGVPFFAAESYHQQYLAKPGSRPYCSAMPTKVALGRFEGCTYQLPSQVWTNYDWSVSHCVLRGENAPIAI